MCVLRKLNSSTYNTIGRVDGANALFELSGEELGEARIVGKITRHLIKIDSVHGGIAAVDPRAQRSWYIPTAQPTPDSREQTTWYCSIA